MPEPVRRAEMLLWDYGPLPSALDLVRNGPASRSLRILAHVFVRVYLGVFHRFRPCNNGQLKHLCGHVIVANHASHLDALALFSAFPLRKVNSLRALCAKDYFLSHPWKQKIAFLLANAVPMDRDRFDAQAISYCLTEMRRGANLILFPEGTRSPDGRMAAFKAGVGLLALKYRLPVLPAAVRGAYECCPKGRLSPRPGAIRVTFGQPVRYRGPRKGRQNWVSVACDLRRRVARLSVQAHQERTYHERTATGGTEDARPYDWQVERRRPHRLRARAHLRKDDRLRLPEPALGKTAGR